MADNQVATTPPEVPGVPPPEEKEKPSKVIGGRPSLDEPPTPYSKSAILLIAVGVGTAAAVLKHLPDDEVEKLSIEMAKLKDVSSDQVQVVIEEFYQMMMAKQYVSSGGLDYAKQVLEKAWGMRKAEDFVKRIEAATEVSAFYLLQTVDDAQLLSFLEGEHPQTAALILANLKPKQAASILSALSEDLQNEISYRLVTMEKTSPEMVKEIEAVLREQLGNVFGGDMRKTGGAHAVAEILNNASRSAEKNILDHLRERDPEVAMEVTNLMFVFEDLNTLADSSIQKIVKEVDSKTLAMALKATSEDLREKVFSNMSDRAAGMLKDELEFLGPVRVRDVEESQSTILEIVRRLDDAGEITISRGEGAEELIE